MYKRNTKYLLTVVFSSFLLLACQESPPVPEEAQEVIDKVNETIAPIVDNLNKESLMEKYDAVQTQIGELQQTIEEKKIAAETKAKELEQMLSDTKDKTEEKIADVKGKVDEAKNAYDEAINALAKLNEAAGDLKAAITP